MQVAPDVFAFPIDFDDGERTVHPAGVATDSGLVLVDAGPPDSVGELERRLGEDGFGLGDVETVFLTHQDWDHAAALRDVVDRTGATVIASVGDAPYIAGDRRPIKSGGDRYPPVPVDVGVVDGAVLWTAAGEARVVATPGHTPGHVSLFLPDRGLLIAGDALNAEDPVGGPKPEFTPDMEAATRSVGRLAGLDVARTLCYHGGALEWDAARIRGIHEELRG